MRDIEAFQESYQFIVNFYCKKCLEGDLTLCSMELREVETDVKPNVKLECIPEFCYLGDTLGVGGDPWLVRKFW